MNGHAFRADHTVGFRIATDRHRCWPTRRAHRPHQNGVNHTGCGWPLGLRTRFLRSTSARCHCHIPSWRCVTFTITAPPTITPSSGRRGTVAGRSPVRSSMAVRVEGARCPLPCSASPNRATTLPPGRLPPIAAVIAGVEIKPLADDLRRPRAIFHRLDPPQNQLGIRLAD
jgi:hypothetical protein